MMNFVQEQNILIEWIKKKKIIILIFSFIFHPADFWGTGEVLLKLTNFVTIYLTIKV